MSRGRAYRRWKAFNKCVYRIKKRLCWAGMSIECGERTFTDFKGNKHTQKVWREPTDWKEAKANNKWVGRLRKTTVRHSNPLDKVEDKQYNKKRRQESKDIIGEELSYKNLVENETLQKDDVMQLIKEWEEYKLFG